MKIAVISSSNRSGSQSLKVSKWLASHAASLDTESSVLDLHELKLPLYDVGQTESENTPELLKALGEADAAVFVSPEWNGMASHSLVNMQHYVGKELAHKPVMLVGVSAGRGGQYPLLQMRTMGYKNNQYVISPESLLVQEVNGVLNTPGMGSESGTDTSVKARADYGLKVLLEYAKSLKAVRESGVVDHVNFENGV